MSAFSISPITNIPPPAAQEFPDFIQFQEDGVNLGGPDADTLNFVGLKATRGVGENSNVVTVTGGAPSLLQLASIGDPPGPIMAFDNVFSPGIWASGTPLVESQNWEWNGFDEVLLFHTAGLYQIIATSFIEPDSVNWPAGSTTYGSQIGDPDFGGSRGVQARFRDEANPEDTRLRMTWTDQHIINVASAETSYGVGLFASAEDTGAGVLFAGMQLAIVRLSDPI